jgi:lipopolysaccharide biosynthesis glycosyltransferase
MKEQIHIACAADNAYVQHLGVMLISLFENNKNNFFHIHLFSASFNITNQKIIEEIVHSFKQQFSFYPLRSSDFEGFYISEHISLATYYRIVIPNKLSPSIGKVIYIDADIIVSKNIEPFWLTQLPPDNIIGAVQEPSFQDFKRLDIPEACSYFNAGVLLINLEKWREENLTLKVLQYIKKFPEKIVLWDQDALNACLYNKWASISPEWNIQTNMYELDKPTLLKKYGQGILEAIDTPSIIHYTGSSKPWNYMNIHPKRNAYFHYLRLSPWREYKYQDISLTKRFLKIFKLIAGQKRYEKLMKKLAPGIS